MSHPGDHTAPQSNGAGMLEAATGGRRLGWRFIAIYALAWAGVWAALLPPILVGLGLRLRVIDPANASSSLSLVVSIGAIVAMIANPVFGHLSDRTTSRFGMRRPWLVGGALAGAAGLLLVACAESVWQVTLGWCLTQLAYNAQIVALLAILPDQVPAQQRGLVSGVTGMGLPVGMVGGTYLVWAIGASTVATFLVPAAIAVVTAAGLAAALPDRRFDVAVQRGEDEERTGPHNSRPAYRDFTWLWVSRFLLFMGIAVLLTYQGYYLIRELGVAPDDVPRWIFLATFAHSAALMIASYYGGSRSDVAGRRKTFLLAAALIYALGLVDIVSASTLGWFLAGRVLTGFGEGMYSAVGMALAADVMPGRHRDAGRNLGILNIAAALPQSLAPAVAPLILLASGGRHLPLFVIAALFAVAAALAAARVREAR